MRFRLLRKWLYSLVILGFFIYGCAQPSYIALKTWKCTFLSKPDGAVIYCKDINGDWGWRGVTPYTMTAGESGDPVMAKYGDKEVFFNVAPGQSVVQIDFTTDPPSVR